MPSEPGTSIDETRSPADQERDADSEANRSLDFDATASLDSEPDSEPDTVAIEWGPVRFERLRSLAFGASVTAVGLLAVTLIFLAVGVAGSLLGGGGPPASTWALLVILLVGGPMSLLYWIVAYGQTSPERRRELLSQFATGYSLDPSGFRLGWTLAGAGSLLGVVVAAAGIGPFSPVSALGPALAPLLFSALVFLPVIAGSRGIDVRLDPAAETIERTYRSHDRTRSDDLGSVVRTRRIDFPWTTVFLLAYRGNAWYRSTPWLFVPTDLADGVERGLDAALALSDGPDRASVPERVILAVVGSSSLVVGLAMTFAAGEGAAGALLALLTAPFSLLFLALAARL